MVNLGRFSQQPLRQMTRMGLATNAAGVEQQINMNWAIASDYNASTANADKAFFYLFCNGAETVLDVQIWAVATGGIFDVYLNDVLDTAGIDTYSAVSTLISVNVALTTDTIPGINTIELRTNGRNGLSGGWVIITIKVRLR